MPELVVASAIAGVMFIGLLVGIVALRRGFEAAEFQMAAQVDQARVLDFLSRDIRNASNHEVKNGGTALYLEIPGAPQSSLSLNLASGLLSILSVTPPPEPPVQVNYYREGNNLIREENGVATSLAPSVSFFQVAQSGTSMTVEVQFQPRFSRSAAPWAREATSVRSTVSLRNSISF